MPQLDKTGPQGLGPKTGRGMGPCGGGMGFGRRGCFGGRGWGMGKRFYAMTGEDKKEMLKNEAKYLKEDLKMIEEEIESLEK